MLRSILHRLFVPVHQAANGLVADWGPDAPRMPGYREALIESSVCLNAAQAAYSLQMEVERSWRSEIQVLYGVYNLFTHQVSMPPPVIGTGSDEARVNLAYAPTHPRDFDNLATEMAMRLRSHHPPRAASDIILPSPPDAPKK